MKILTISALLVQLAIIGYGLYQHESVGFVCGWAAAFIANLQVLSYQVAK